MKATFRLNSARRHCVRESFVGRVVQMAPHLRTEAITAADRIFGVDDYQPPQNSWRTGDPLAAKEERIRGAADFAKRLNRRSPISVHIGVAVDGELSKQVGQVWKAFVHASKQDGSTTPLLALSKNGVRLEWATGHYQIARRVFLPKDDCNGYVGAIEIDTDLLARGGAFQIEKLEDRIVLRSVGARIKTWKLALAFMRDQSQGRARRGSLRYRDILRRFRSGAAISFAAATGSRCYSQRSGSEVTLAGGKVDHEFSELLARRHTRLARGADRIAEYRTALQGYGQSRADEFLAGADVKRLNAERELAAARSEFDFAASELHRVQLEACYKKDLPAFPYQSPPRSYPMTKAASDGVLRRHRFARDRFSAAWERLTAAVAASQAPLSESTDEPTQIHALRNNQLAWAM